MIRLKDLIGRIEDHLYQGLVMPLEIHQARPITRTPQLAGTITAPVDIYTELHEYLRHLSADERGHFIPKAQGAEHGELIGDLLILELGGEIGRASCRERVL